MVLQVVAVHNHFLQHIDGPGFYPRHLVCVQSVQHLLQQSRLIVLSTCDGFLLGYALLQESPLSGFRVFLSILLDFPFCVAFVAVCIILICFVVLLVEELLLVNHFNALH